MALIGVLGAGEPEQDHEVLPVDGGMEHLRDCELDVAEAHQRLSSLGDGLIRARRGVGRFVADTLPRIGIERIRPFEEVLGGPGQHLEIKRIQRERQPASEFVAPGVGVEPGADCWLWESVLIRDGEAIAHLQENISALPVSLGSSSAAAPLEIDDDGGSTLLASLNNRFGRVLGPGECQRTLFQLGPRVLKSEHQQLDLELDHQLTEQTIIPATMAENDDHGSRCATPR